MEMSGQGNLFPLSVSVVLPGDWPGGDLAFRAMIGSEIYYCKRDKDGRPVCATEWFCTSLAQHLAIPVPDFGVVACPYTGDLIWGSKNAGDVAGRFELDDFLQTPPADGVHSPFAWLGRYLSGLYVLDLFVGNPDRQACNFLLAKAGGARRLLAFDFASARLDGIGGTTFPLEASKTFSVGRALRAQQGFFQDSAAEMLDRIGAVPVAVIRGVVESMPDDWLTGEQKRGICELWSNGKVGDRLQALRRGIKDESLL